MSTSTFISIPLEIFLLILQHLPVSSLTTLEATSKDIQNVIFAHEDVIYRSAYSLHGFLHSNPQSLTTLEDIRAEHPQLFQGDIGGWKTACMFPPLYHRRPSPLNPQVNRQETLSSRELLVRRRTLLLQTTHRNRRTRLPSQSRRETRLHHQQRLRGRTHRNRHP